MITLEWYLTSLVMTAFVSMLTTVDDILCCARTGNDVASSPASNNLFSIDSTSALLSDDEREYFHSMVAKLL